MPPHRLFLATGDAQLPKLDSGKAVAALEGREAGQPGPLRVPLGISHMS